jgi:hypothetical protein
MAISEPGAPPSPSRGELGSASGKVENIVSTQRLLTINAGSSSLKAALYRLQEDTMETPELPPSLFSRQTGVFCELRHHGVLRGSQEERLKCEMRHSTRGPKLASLRREARMPFVPLRRSYSSCPSKATLQSDVGVRSAERHPLRFGGLQCPGDRRRRGRLLDAAQAAARLCPGLRQRCPDHRSCLRPLPGVLRARRRVAFPRSGLLVAR